ncbi:MAG TPA: hypothetical protein VIL09_20210 [Microvirga sp.]|jgi:hypothetical protein
MRAPLHKDTVPGLEQNIVLGIREGFVVAFTEEEIEQHRLEGLAQLDADPDEKGWRERSAPGSFGCHEALHMAAYLMQQVDEQLTDHRAIVQNPEWYLLASQASTTLFNLYQAIGAAHLGEESER